MISARSRFWLRCLASTGLIALIATKVNWASLGSILSKIDLGITFATSVLTPFLIVLLAARWRIFLGQQEVVFPFHQIFGLTWAGQFFNSVLPGSTGGDVVKIYQVCRMFPDKKAASVVSVVADRLSALFALGALAALGVFLGPTWEILQLGLGFNERWLWPTAGLVLLALVLGVVCYKMRRSHLAGRAQHFLSILKTSLRWNRKLAGAIILSVVIHLLNFTIFFGFARALGLSLSYVQVLVMLPIIMTLLLLPLTINGHGLREALLIFYFSYWQISALGEPSSRALELAMSVSLLGVVNDLLWSLPGGLWYLFAKRA